MPVANPKRFPTFWQLQGAGWVCFYLLVLVGSLPDFGHPGALRNQSIGVLFMFLGSCALHPLCRVLSHRADSWVAFELRMSMGAVALGTLGAFGAELSVLGFGEMQWANLATNSVQFAVVLFLWGSLYFSIKQWQQSVLERERLLRAEAEAREARLSALRYQLNPHFLFNSLNAVSTLVLDGNAPAATRMLAQIADLLRTTLEGESTLEVPLSQEISFATEYLGIEQTRLGDRLQVDIAIAPQTFDALVPNMLLQPLIENAVRHGVAACITGGKVFIHSAVVNGRLRLVIRNSGAQQAGPSSEDGIGLRNTKERLKTLYGTRYDFRLQWPDDGGCEALVEIPLQIRESTEEAVCAR